MQTYTLPYPVVRIPALRILRSFLLSVLALESALAGSPPLGSCDEPTLRAAVEAGGTVEFNCDAFIRLSRPLRVVNQVELIAVGHRVMLSGNGVTRLFEISSTGRLTLRNLTLIDGLAAGTNTTAMGMEGGAGEGGAILNLGGTVAAFDCRLANHRALGGEGGTEPDLFSLPGSGGAGRGGALFSLNGQVALHRCEFLTNEARGGLGGVGNSESLGGTSRGGACFIEGGSALFEACLFEANRSRSGRGRRSGALRSSGVASAGAAEFVNASVLLQACRFLRCESVSESGAIGLGQAQGGALAQTGGTLAMLDSVLVANRSLAGFGQAVSTPLGRPGGHSFGGALRVLSGSAGITNSTFEGNIALGGGQRFGEMPGAGNGGAIVNAGEVSVVNSTLVQNVARGGEALYGGSRGGGRGGALANLAGGHLLVLSSTIVSNSAAASPGSAVLVGVIEQGGGLYNEGPGVLALGRSILAHNPAGSNSYGAVLDDGSNLSSDATPAFSAPGSRNDVDPVLSPLADFGGPTPTMAPLQGSPAIDGAGTEPGPSLDQRGRSRPYGAAFDIGAVESSPPYSVHGRFFGPRVRAGLEVSVVGQLAQSAQDGRFIVKGLEAGASQAIPESPGFFFLPASVPVVLSADIFGLSFRAYEIHSLEVSGGGLDPLTLTYAGVPSEEVVLEFSPDLLSWTPLATNRVPSSGLWEAPSHSVGSIGHFQRFYRATR